MGTNYYARIIPTKSRKEDLIEAINADDFAKIRDIVSDTYTKIEYYGSLQGGVVHLGKRSGGWKFLWNPNMYIHRDGHMKGGRYVSEPNTAFYLYPLTKKGIYDFIMQDNIEIWDEYDEKQDKEEFYKMAIEWTTWKNKEGNIVEAWDSKSYEVSERIINPSYKVYRCSGELIDLIQDEGYEFISESQSDFYSDGLRFATTTDFS